MDQSPTPSDSIHASARIEGESLVVGEQTRIGAGAVITDSYIRNATVEAGAVVVDSVIVGTGADSGHADGGGFRSKWDITLPSTPVIGEGARVTGSTLRDSSVGARTVCSNAALLSCAFGPDNRIDSVYGQSSCSREFVCLQGPTEICGAWLGHHATIDRCGYLEGVFSNDFYVVEFDEASGMLRVRETLDVPHVSRYGMNTINSDNSGNLLPQPDDHLASLGPHAGLWSDALLSHEPLMLGPCVWVHGWTKVIGKSPCDHASVDEMVNDTAATYLMPFAATGLTAGGVNSQVMPGELHDGGSHKQRVPAWTFSYAPGAIFAAVKRMIEATGDVALAGRLPKLALESARAVNRYHARVRGVDLKTAAESAKGWKGWLARADRVLAQHIESGLWEFEGGEPVNWKLDGATWTPSDPARLTDIAPDALGAQRTEDELASCDQDALARTLGLGEQEAAATRNATEVSDEARVSPGAFIGPGTQIRGASVVEDGAWLWRTVVDNSTVRAGARLARCAVVSSSVGSEVDASSTAILDSDLGDGSSVTAARIESSRVAGPAKVNPYAAIRTSALGFPSIVGSNIDNSDVRSVFMSYHMPGQVSHLVVEPTVIDVDGASVEVEAIPMLGGGCRVRGEKDKPVRMPCAFIGSNAIVEGGAYVGFGSFVLGRLCGDEGLPPFTVSTAPGPERDGIGMVVHSFANMVITHFVSWAYQALGPDRADHVGRLVGAMLEEGVRAVEWALATKASSAWDEASPFAKYKSLETYSEAQLNAGLKAYHAALDDGRWNMRYEGGELRFTSDGAWTVSGGAARWRPAP